MNVCHDCYKMFDAGSEISPCCDCPADVLLMESSSPAPFCSTLILILLLKKISQYEESLCLENKQPHQPKVS